MCLTGTHREVSAVKPSKSPSGRVVRALEYRRLWVSREGDGPRKDNTSATNHVLVPHATIYKRWLAHQDAPMTFECTRNVRERSPPRYLGTILIENEPIQ